jgi:hypothetical protein
MIPVESATVTVAVTVNSVNLVESVGTVATAVTIAVPYYSCYS